MIVAAIIIAHLCITKTRGMKSTINVKIISRAVACFEEIMYALNQLQGYAFSFSYCPEIQLCDMGQHDLIIAELGTLKTASAWLDNLRNNTAKIIALTDTEDKGMSLMEIGIDDYCMHGDIKNNLSKLVQKLVCKLQCAPKKNNVQQSLNYSSKLTVPTLNGMNFVDIPNIVRCESDNNYTYIILESKQKFLVAKTLKEYENILAQYGFLRIHRSHLINPKFIAEYVKGRGGYVVLHDKTRIDVAARKKDFFLEKFKQIGPQ